LLKKSTTLFGKSKNTAIKLINKQKKLTNKTYLIAKQKNQLNKKIKKIIKSKISKADFNNPNNSNSPYYKQKNKNKNNNKRINNKRNINKKNKKIVKRELKLSGFTEDYNIDKPINNKYVKSSSKSYVIGSDNKHKFRRGKFDEGAFVMEKMLINKKHNL